VGRVVHKYGGSSVADAESIKRVAQRIVATKKAGNDVVVVISAMGKTTNALEKVAEAFYSGHKDEALELFRQIKESHLTTAKYLLVHNYLAAEAQLKDFFTEVEWLLHDKPVRDFDYYYDQIVCVGELLSTSIVSAYLAESGLDNQWIDVRDIFRTDSNFRDAAIDWDYSQKKVVDEIKPLFAETNMVVTQGFIGATSDNESTTLGREGSDYTAAVFAGMLNAESQTIWKDVEGVMNADPKLFPEATILSELNYDEVIEMAYYGAQVIHPKTIKPLANKGIPLHVKSFLDPSLEGTIIHECEITRLPPLIVFKENQCLISCQVTDYSFINEQQIGIIFQTLSEQNIKINVMQNSAISFSFCVDFRENKILKLIDHLGRNFEVYYNTGLTLITVKNYDAALYEEYRNLPGVILEQSSRSTFQVLVKSPGGVH